MAEDTTTTEETATEATEETTQAVETTAETVLSDTSDKVATAPADWPEDWRDKFSGGDEKEAKFLGRYKSPMELYKAGREAQRKLSSGEVKSSLPEDASDEDIAQYRKDNGIPEKPDGYLEALPDGLVIGDADKALADSFLERVHGKNADPAVVAEALSWYKELEETSAASIAEADKKSKQEGEDALRSEWGNEFRGNQSSVLALLQSGPTQEDGTSFDKLILQSRLPDGTPFANNPDVLKFLLGLADNENPAGFVAPSDGKTQAESIDAEIASIEKVMKTDRRAYNKDQAMQDRYLKLLEAKEKLSSKAA